MKLDFDFTPAGWATLRALLGQALELPAEARPAWLDRLAPEHRQFQGRLKSLLAHAQDGLAVRVLNTLPQVETDQFALPHRTGVGEAVPPGEMLVGPYRLLREIGSGGMASVWLAERTDVLQQRKVALKLPHGAWRRAGLAERMARERDILASLEHANIARLYDAGVAEDGQPYLALELVDGQRIDTHCVAQGLSTEARLRLFLQVARAVAHAHGRLVVHRDLKPSNLLVTESGQVRLLDFGIAKLLDQGVAGETELTRASGRVLTVDYASPEQIRGEHIGTASDQYSLGVVLYELLTGTRPYQLPRASAAALEEAILLTDPPRPSLAVGDSKVQRELRGDLDAIVLKALRKAPASRYATVDALADDIERHLNRQPVLAQPDRLGYRAHKFIQRHRLAVSAGLAVTLAVAAGTSVAVWQAGVARAEQRRAEAVKNFVTSMLTDAEPYGAAKSNPSVEDLLQQANARLAGRFEDQPALRVELLTTIGSSLSGISRFEAAEKVLQQAIDEGTAKLGPRQLDVLRARGTLATVHRFRGQLGLMKEELDPLLADMRATPGLPARDLFNGLVNSLHLAIDQGRYPEALTTAHQLRELAAANFPPRDADTLRSLMLLSLAHSYLGQHEPSLDFGRQALNLAVDLHGSAVPHARVLDARALVGRALGNLGRYRDAVEELTVVVRDAKTLLGPRSAMVGFYSFDVSRFQLELGEATAALAHAEQGVDVITSLAQADSYTVAMAKVHVGRALLAQRQAARALSTLEGARETLRVARGPQHPQTLDVEAHIAMATAWLGRPGPARELIDKVLEPLRSAPVRTRYQALHFAGAIHRLQQQGETAKALQEQALDVLPELPMNQRRRRAARVELALLALDRGDVPAASRWLETGDVAGLPDTAGNPDEASLLLAWARLELARGRADRAIEPMNSIDRFWRERGPDSRWSGEAAYWLARCNAALNHPAEARAALRRAAEVLGRSSLPSDQHLAQLAQRG